MLTYHMCKIYVQRQWNIAQLIQKQVLTNAANKSEHHIDNGG